MQTRAYALTLSHLYKPTLTHTRYALHNTQYAQYAIHHRYGDDFTGNTATLCVRRATYWCPDLGAEDPAKKGERV